MSLSSLYDERVLRRVDALENELGFNPAFKAFRERFIKQLAENADTLATYSPEQIVSTANTFEELVAMKGYLQERFGNEQNWWNYYHQRRVSLALSPSYYGRNEFGLPIAPKIFHRGWGSGAQSVSVQRNLFSKKFSREQLLGQEAIPKIDFAPRRFSPPPITSKFVSIDIETTGLLRDLARKTTGSARGVFSTGIVGQGLSEWSQRVLPPRAETRWIRGSTDTRPFFGYVIENEIIPRGEKAAALAQTLGHNVYLTTSEQEVTERFLTSIKNLPGSTAVLGYNVKGFDIPFMGEMARRYGLTGLFEQAFPKTRQIIDIAESAQGFLSEQLAGKYVGWQESMFTEMGMKPRGWTLEAVAAAFDYKPGGIAHTPVEDANMASHVYGVLQDKSKAQRLWDAGGFERYKTVLSEKGADLIPLEEFAKLTETRGGQTFFKPRGDLLSSLAEYEKPVLERLSGSFGSGKYTPPAETTAVGEALAAAGRRARPFVQKGLNAAKFIGAAAIAGTVLPGEGIGNSLGGAAAVGAWQLTKRGLSGTSMAGSLPAKLLAAGLAFAAAKGVGAAMAPDYQVVGERLEGFPEGGISEAIRRSHTDFGSPWRGPKISGPVAAAMAAGGLLVGGGALALALSSSDNKVSVYGQEIDPRIVEFREEWIQDQENRKELKAIKDAAYAANAPGEAEDWRVQDLGGGLARINTEGLSLVWDDPDTLLLQQPWYKPWKDDVHIRLVGVDAPEVYHEDQPVPWTRWMPSQPFGEEAKQETINMLEGKNLEVVVESDPKARSYGRYLGLIFAEGQEEPINLELVKRGYAAALPWGESGSDIYPRQEFLKAEQEAIGQGLGMWSEPYWRKYLDVSSTAGRRITFTSFADLERLSANYSLAAAESLMRSDKDYSSWMGRFIGSRLGLKGQRFSGKDDAYNTIEGLRHGGWAQETRRSLTDFGSGFMREMIKNRGIIALKQLSGREALSGLGRNLASVAGRKESFHLWEAMTGIRGWKTTEDLAKKSEKFMKRVLREPPRPPQNILRTAEQVAPTVPVKIPAALAAAAKEEPLNIAIRMKQFDALKELDVKIENLMQKVLKEGPSKGLPSPFKKQNVIFYPPPKLGKFPGMPDEGMSSEMRESLTEFKKEFASRWDKFKHIAAKLLKQGRTTEEVLSAGKRIKSLGRGEYGEAFLHSVVHEGKEIKFVVKEARVPEEIIGTSIEKSVLEGNKRALQKEYEALADIRGDIMPSPYFFDPSGRGRLYMEYMPGKTLEQMKEAGEALPREVWGQLREQADVVARKGFENLDVNLGNIMFDPQRNRVSWIDFGKAQRKENIKFAQINMQRVINTREELSTPIEGTFSLWGRRVRADTNVSLGRAAEALRRQEKKFPSVAVPHVMAHEGGHRHMYVTNKAK